MRIVTVLLVTMAAAVLLLALSAEPATFFLPVIGALAVLLFTFAIEMDSSTDDRPSAMRDETKHHHW